jgi:hypothetical protein
MIGIESAQGKIWNILMVLLWTISWGTICFTSTPGKYYRGVAVKGSFIEKENIQNVKRKKDDKLKTIAEFSQKTI